MNEYMNLEFREATSGDKAFGFYAKKRALEEYVELAFGWDEARQLALHEERWPTQTYLVITYEGQDAGIVAFEPGAGELVLNQLYILPEFQNLGIGSEVLHYLDRKGYSAIRLRVLKVNPRAQAFYERHGFGVVDETETHRTLTRAIPPVEAQLDGHRGLSTPKE